MVYEFVGNRGAELVTAKLNNNNKEFHWWWVVVGGLHTHNRVKPTSTWLWLSWVLTIVSSNAICIGFSRLGINLT